VLTRSQHDELEANGLLHLPGLVATEALATLRRQVLALFDGACAREAAGPGFTLYSSATSDVAKAFGFEALWGSRAVALVDDVLGAGHWHRPIAAGQVLPLSLPVPDVEWDLPHKVWHLDYMAPTALDRAPGVQLFLCLDRVEPRAGGTVVACGSHRLVDALRRREAPSWRGSSADVKKRLRATVPWVAALGSLREGEDRRARFMDAVTEWEGVPLRVVELVGEPGDVFAMHPWLLHAPAPNCGERPRLVLTERFRRT